MKTKHSKRGDRERDANYIDETRDSLVRFCAILVKGKRLHFRRLLTCTYFVRIFAVLLRVFFMRASDRAAPDVRSDRQTPHGWRVKQAGKSFFLASEFFMYVT